MSAVFVQTSSSAFYFPHPVGAVSEILAITGHISSFIGGSLLYPAADEVPEDLFIPSLQHHFSLDKPLQCLPL